MLRRNATKSTERSLGLVVGYAAVWCLLGLVAAGGVAYAALDRVSNQLVLPFAIFAAVALLISGALWSLRHRFERHGPGDANSGGNGGGTWPPDGPGPWGADDELMDWERFEREFRAYAQRWQSAHRSG
jgi:hypothetical protein